MDFVNKEICKIDDILSFIDTNINTNKIVLNFNNLEEVNLSILPENIVNIELENNLITIENIIFGDRNWEKIVIRNNTISINELKDIKCKILELTDNELYN